MDPIRQLDIHATPAEKAKATAQGIWKHWSQEIAAADKREKDFRKEGVRVCKIFEGQEKERYQFNILYSNIETLSPALYNSTPRPDVRPREQRPAPQASLAAKLGSGLLTYLLDDGSPRSQTFSAAMKAAVTAALVPGRGVTWITYDPVIKKLDPPKPAEGASKPPPAEEVVEAQYICVEEVPWNEFRHGFAKAWKDVPWVARVQHMTLDEVTRLTGNDKLAREVSYTCDEEEEDEERKRESRETEGEKTAAVYQIWDRERKQVFYWTDSYKESCLKVDEDPYQLEGFFPCPPPLRFVERLSNLTPVAQYAMYEEQAKELNAITLRINRIVRALKVRGGYDSNLSDEVKKILTADDNEMVGLTNATALSSQGVTLDKAIWLWPLDKLITVLQQLYIAREACKQTIYEIMGVSDIVRGATVASESATAQNLKDKWTGVRIKRPQATVQDYVRDSLRLMLELAVTHLEPDLLYKMSGTNAPRQADVEKQAMVLQQQLPLMPPEQQQQGQQQLQQLQSTPTFEQALGILQDDLQRSFVVDIETNSTIDAEATEDKQDINELLTSLGGFLTSVGPMVQQGILPFEAAQAMMLAVSRRFRFGREIEDHIKQMQPPQPQGDPQAQKDQQKAKEEQAKLQEQQMTFEFDKKLAMRELELERKEFEMEKKFAEREMQMQAQQQQQDLAFKEQAAVGKIKQAAGQATMGVQNQQNKLKLQQQAAAGKSAGGGGSGGGSSPARTAVAAPPPAPDVDLSPLIEGLRALQTAIADLKATITAPRTGKAVKQPDGSWAMQSTPQAAPPTIQ